MHLVLLLLLAALPPLTDEQRIALETAHDGRDYQEPAFVALLEHVATWTNADEPSAAAPDLNALLDDPDAARGGIFRVEGTLLRHDDHLPPPYDHVDTWFVRGGDQQPIMVFVDRPSRSGRFRNGETVSIVARFYKFIDEVAVDGKTRRYGAFVGAFPQRIGQPTAGLARSEMTVLAAVVGGMLLVFTVLMLRLRKQRASIPPRRPMILSSARDGGALDDASFLPDDPVAALEELRRRAQGRPD